MRDKYTEDGVLPYINGFENQKKNSTGWHFNFILSNGDRSEQALKVEKEEEEGNEDEDDKKESEGNESEKEE